MDSTISLHPVDYAIMLVYVFCVVGMKLGAARVGESIHLRSSGVGVPPNCL
jgi:hypothetical protein